MNILKKIEDKTYQNADLINNIDLNPIAVSYTHLTLPTKLEV